MSSLAWPIEEVFLRPIATLLLAVLVPIATGKLLAVLLLPKAVPEDPFEAARVVAPFRRAALIVGVVQIGIAWWLGSAALGPALVATPDGGASDAFALATVVVAVMAGAAGRRFERPGASRGELADAALVRLRLLALLFGPVLAMRLVSLVPIVTEGVVSWPLVVVALALVAVSVAFGGLALAVASRALVPAPVELAARMRRAAEREGVTLRFALRLPTRSSHFANAAAIPWARAMIVTDRLVESLSPEALDAVLAHEAAHLSEGPRVAGMRLSAAFLVFSAVAVVTPLEPVIGSVWAVPGLFVLAVVLALVARRLARKMEERADAHARDKVGNDALADALLGLARTNLSPLTTGSARRVHPDLYDRITACGRDLGPRPTPPASRLGGLAGLALALALLAATYATVTATAIEDDDVASVSGETARRRQRIWPWDPNAMLALAWDASRDERYDEAEARIEAAAALGATPATLLESRAEVAAARGDCDEAGRLFDESLAERARLAFEDPSTPLELGGWHLPPSLVSECRRSVEDLAPGPDPFELFEDE